MISTDPYSIFKDPKCRDLLFRLNKKESLSRLQERAVLKPPYPKVYIYEIPLTFVETIIYICI